MALSRTFPRIGVIAETKEAAVLRFEAARAAWARLKKEADEAAKQAKGR